MSNPAPESDHVERQPREHQRERDVQRYYQGWSSAQGSSLNVALNVDSLAAADLQGIGYKPKGSQDKALAAFAQLAVLRLNVRRAMVSLIDGSNQMVLAEATRSLFVEDNANNDLWLGSTILKREDAICYHSLSNTYTAHDPNDPDISFTAAGMVVPDLSEDERFQTRPYVVAEPGIRFFAGVPILSRTGHKIGTYTVSDEKPRHGLTIEELRFMQGVAQAVMGHLEWAADRVDRFKGERIVRGLASFIEGASLEVNETPAAVQEDLNSEHPTLRPPQMSLGRGRRPLSRHNSGSNTNGYHSSTASGYDTTVSRNSSDNQEHQNGGVKGDQSSSIPNQIKPDSMSRMFNRAAELLRQSTLADGVVLFDATPIHLNSKLSVGNILPGSIESSDDDDSAQHQTTSESESLSMDTDNPDASPSSRPCKILAYSLASEAARADIERGSAITLGTLEKYYNLFPQGKSFSFTDEGAGISSEDESTSDRERQGYPTTPNSHKSSRRYRKARMDHKEFLAKIPGAKAVVFIPLYDHAEDRLAGGCFLWTAMSGRMMNLDEDMSYLRAFGSSIISEIGRINTQKNEAAKTTFIASMSHELRSPLHGILGAAEFLIDTATDSYQSGLITSISTCGKTLLDTLNHVLDYSKINKLGRVQMRKHAKQNKQINLSSDSSMESLNMTAVVDLAILVEEVVDAVTAGHTFKKLPHSVRNQNGYSSLINPTDASSSGTGSQSSLSQSPQEGEEEPVSVLLDIDPRSSWLVQTQPGALRRIIMNLLGNALKYTASGFVLVSLRGQNSPDGSKTEAVIRVIDTGKGMSPEFQRDRLFIPFSQEDSFQPGTGLGLSIVKQIVDSLGGCIELKSQQHKGTEVDVRIKFKLAPKDAAKGDSAEVLAAAEETKGLQLVLLEAESLPAEPHTAHLQMQKLNDTLTDTCSNWFGMKVSKEDTTKPVEADMYMYCEPPSLETLQRRFKEDKEISGRNRDIPVIIVCLNAQEAIKIAQSQCKALADFGKIVEVIPQPCGPKKVARAFQHCLRRAEQMANMKRVPNGDISLCLKANTLAAPHISKTDADDLNGEEHEGGDEAQYSNAGHHAADREKLMTSTMSQFSPPPLDPATPQLLQQMLLNGNSKPTTNGDEPKEVNGVDSVDKPLHVLLVDDNKINLQLLVMFMRKCGFSYEEAMNGQEALDKFKDACLPGPRTTSDGASAQFDFVLMDISMPVMNGIEATRRIRDFERENNLPSTNVIALTGLASRDAQRDAKSAGIDIFLPKPVRFAELKKLLTAK
ncbi:histidine kinase 4 [Apiospora arundinis]|uniref:Histidine kinase 4 n=1 Tax=Apiospora arundinis TaxID=335852 RepID=A0ABR2JGQ0_9PEZI